MENLLIRLIIILKNRVLIALNFCQSLLVSTVARRRGFMFNQINKLTKKIYCNLSHINIHFYLKPQIPMCHRHFFRKLSQNRKNIQTFCNDRKNFFHFACRQWYSYNNPQCNMV